DDCSFSNKSLTAFSWLGISISIVSFASFISNVKSPSGRPIRSINPLASTSSAGMRINWNFNEELLALIAKTCCIDFRSFIVFGCQNRQQTRYSLGREYLPGLLYV